MIEATRWLAPGLVLLAGCSGRDPPESRERLGEPAVPRTAAAPVPSAPPKPVRFVAPLAAGSSVPAVEATTPVVEASAAPSPTPAAAPVPASRQAFAPRDECAGLPGFAAFRQALVAAVRSRDAEALAKLATADVRLDFGGGSGPEELRRRLSGGRSELWLALESLLPLGCAADGGVATMPWIFSRMPETVDAYQAMLVLGQKVPLLRRPSPDAPVLDRLDWALVTLAGDVSDNKARFREVVVPGGGRGYVETAKLRGLLDYRVIADRVAGEWRITAFVAGD